MSYSRAFWWATVLNLLCLSGSNMFVLFPGYLAHRGLTRWEIGLVEGVFWVGAVASQPWLASRLDRHGRRPYFVCGAAGMGVAALAFLLTPVSLVPMALLRCLHGFVIASYFTAMFAWVADQAPAGRTAQAFGYYGISGLLAAAVGPLVGEALVHGPGYGALFSASAACSLVSAALMAGLREIPRERHERTPEGFFRLARSRTILGVSAGCLGFGYAVGCLFAFAAPYLAEHGVRGTGLLFACYVASSVAVRLALGATVDRVGGARVIPAAMLVQAAGMGVFAALGSWETPVVVITGLVAGAGHGVLYPALSSLAVDRLGPSVRGTALALITAWIDLGSVLGAALPGVIAHHIGYPAMFLWLSVSVALVGLGFAPLDRRSATSPSGV
ncbi:MAG: MFS transporter [Candidatus Eremiobacterota bacterium]